MSVEYEDQKSLARRLKVQPRDIPAMLKAGDIPRPVKMITTSHGKVPRWRADHVDLWILRGDEPNEGPSDEQIDRRHKVIRKRGRELRLIGAVSKTEF